MDEKISLTLKEWVYDRQMRIKDIIDYELAESSIIGQFYKDINIDSGNYLPEALTPRFR